MRNATYGRGFSLVELLVALAILAVIVGILLPVVPAVRRAARVTRCASNLRQIGQALHAYRADHNAWPDATAMPAPFKLTDLGEPDAPTVVEALAGHLPPDGGVWRCPGDADEVFDRCAPYADGRGTSYLYWVAFQLPRPHQIVMSDYQGNSALGLVGEFHPPRRGMNQLLGDGSVHFGHAMP